jgi:hypothetical protein
MKPETPSDIGPFHVEFTKDEEIRIHHTFSDIPNQAAFPYAKNRAIRAALLWLRATPGGVVHITHPSGNVNTIEQNPLRIS